MLEVQDSVFVFNARHKRPGFVNFKRQHARYFLKGMVWFLVGLAVTVAVGVNEGWE